jgi:hypothetical protein
MTDKGYTIKWNIVRVNDFDDYYRSIKRSYWYVQNRKDSVENHSQTDQGME